MKKLTFALIALVLSSSIAQAAGCYPPPKGCVLLKGCNLSCHHHHRK